MKIKTAIITDWRTKDEDLPDVAPGEEFERVIAPQKFVVLHRILVRELILVRLEVGAVTDVPFELIDTDGDRRTYKLGDLRDETLCKRLVAVGAAAAGRDTIAISPLLEVRVHLRNEGTVPAKPSAALIVQEEP